MASCYGRISAPSVGIGKFFERLPIKTSLPDGTKVEVDIFRESEHEAGRRLMNIVIEEGLSWPFEDAMDIDAFRAYFLSHAAFVVRAIPFTASTSTFETTSSGSDNDHGSDGTRDGRFLSVKGTEGGTIGFEKISTEKPEQQVKGNHENGDDDVSVWGAFYIKPNFPGRCSHVCNGGFITDPCKRRRGVARLMGHAFLRFAKELGYKASYFNLVFRTNEASLRLWRGLGFKELAVVPKAGRLKGIEELVDAIQFHYDLEQLCIKDLPGDLQA